MRLYADTPVRRLAQVGGDLLAVAWAALSVQAAHVVYARTSALAEPGRRLEQAGTDLRTTSVAARSHAADVPGVGDTLAKPFDAIADNGASIAAVGRGQQDAVLRMAMLLAVLVAVVMLSLVLIWLVGRLRWVREASRASRLASVDDGSLLALRALTRQPPDKLLAAQEEPADAWRRGDAEAIRRLAAVELRAIGLKPHPATPLPLSR